MTHCNNCRDGVATQLDQEPASICRRLVEEGEFAAGRCKFLWLVPPWPSSKRAISGRNETDRSQGFFGCFAFGAEHIALLCFEAGRVSHAHRQPLPLSPYTGDDIEIMRSLASVMFRTGAKRRLPRQVCASEMQHIGVAPCAGR